MKIADPNPSYCSSCFQQKPEMLHVDFDAAWDGPVIDGSIKVAIDDLVICRACLMDAWALLPENESDGEIEALQRECEQLATHAAVLQTALDAMTLVKDSKAALR